MAQILLRNLDDRMVEQLKTRATENGRSLHAEVKAILEQAAKVTRANAQRLADELRLQLHGRRFSDSVELLRETRGE